MKKLTILLDLDDVLNNQCELWIERLNSKYGLNMKYNDVTDWDMKKFYPSLGEAEVYEPVLNPALVREMSTTPESIWYTNEWDSRGHTLLVVTSTSTLNIEAKSKWLHNYFRWFSEDKLILSHKKQLIKGDILIDDGIHNLLSDKETGVSPSYIKLCFNRPWNRAFACLPNDICRVFSFSEMDEMIKYLEKGE